MEEDKKSLQGIFVSQTHWDREWYLTFEEFRKWLVKLIDDLIENLPKNPDYKSFMLDGQVLPIEDYLEMRPENEDKFRSLVQQGRIVIGPFYILADEFGESGEGMIRNLLLGHKISEKFGKPMKVGYVADTFGHIWQMPQILNGFGISSMYFYRGYPPLFGNHEEYKGKNDKTPVQFYLQAPDGSKVLTFHDISGYSNSGGITEMESNFPGMFPYINGVQRILDVMNDVKGRNLSNMVLLQNGGDHRQAEWKLPDFIEKWNVDEEIQEDFNIQLRHGTMEEYFDLLREEVKEFPTLTGELRGSMYTQVTPGCLSTRMYLKQQNWRILKELEKYAEPLAALCYSNNGEPQSAFIEKAWKWVLQNHPHDSICGCSLDRVHDDMETRNAWAMDLASDVANYGLAELITGIDTEAIKANLIKTLGVKDQDINLFMAFNPNPFEGGTVEDYIMWRFNSEIKVYSFDGKEIPGVAIEYIEDYHYKLENGQYLYKKYGSPFLIAKIGFYDPALPAFGIKVYAAVNQGKLSVEQVEQKPQFVDKVETQYYKISLNSDGSLNIFDKETNTEYAKVNTYEDMADDGDEYDYGPLVGDKPFHSTKCKAKWEILKDNDLFVEFVAKISFEIPEKLIGSIDVPRVRSEQLKPLDITTKYRIYKNLKHIEITTEFENKMTGHRIRALVPANLMSDHSFADDHFMVMKRTTKLPRDDGWYQDMQGIYNQGLFVDLNNGERGIAAFTRGLPEYEIVDNFNPTNDESNKTQSIAITLVRAVEWLSQKGHLGRKSGLNGPNLKTPGAQCLRKFTFEYAVCPHKGNWQTGLVYKNALKYAYYAKILPFNHRLRNEKLDKPIKEEFSFLKVENPNIILSAVKKSWNVSNAPDGIIIRLFNPSENNLQTDIEINIGFSSIYRTNLCEIPDEEIKATGNKISVSINPYQIFTILLKR